MGLIAGGAFDGKIEEAASVDVEDYGVIDGLIDQVEADLAENFPRSLAYGKKFLLGPGAGGRIQARFSGPDPNELRRLSEEAMAIIEAVRSSGTTRSSITMSLLPVPRMPRECQLSTISQSAMGRMTIRNSSPSIAGDISHFA